MSKMWSSTIPVPDPDIRLNRAVTGRWRSTVAVRATLYFFRTNQLFCLRIVCFYCSNQFYFVSGLRPPNPCFITHLTSRRIPIKCMVEQTIWLWFGWDCFIAHRGFIIIERTDSWKRQLTAGRDSSVIRTALKTRTKLVVINYNSILVQILIVRHNEESTGLQDSHHRVLINRHSPLTMFRKVEDCLFGFQLPCKGTCLIHKHCNLQEWCDRFFRKYISVATTKIRL